MKTIPVTNKNFGDGWHGPNVYYPTQQEHAKLFMHCTEGHIACSKQFLEAYAPVFENHGHRIEIVGDE